MIHAPADLAAFVPPLDQKDSSFAAALVVAVAAVAVVAAVVAVVVDNRDCFLRVDMESFQKDYLVDLAL